MREAIETALLEEPYECECGAKTRDMMTWDDGQEYSAHLHSESHFERIYAAMTPQAWGEVMDKFKHGLGWAESESMGIGMDDDLAMELLRRLVRDHLA